MNHPTSFRGLHRWSVWVVAAGILLPGAARAETTNPAANFSLVRAVPSDVFITVAARTNPERKFLDDYWAEVCEAFSESGIVDDVLDLVTDLIPDEDLEEIESIVDQFSGLVKAVNWGDWFEKELVYCGRFDPAQIGMGSPYEGIVMGRSDKKSAASNYKALKAILNQVVKLVESEDEDAVSVEEIKLHGATVARLVPAEFPASVISIGYRDDVVFASLFGDRLVKECMRLLDGGSKTEALIDTKRFKTAFKDLPEAEDTIVFFDIRNMMEGFGGMVKAIAEESKEDPSAAPWLAMASALLRDLTIAEYSATVEWTDGYRVFSDTSTVLTHDATESGLFKALVNGKSVSDFDRFVPKEATTFSCSAGIEWTALYRYILTFVRKHVPESQAGLADWADIQKDWDLDIEKDILGLLEGPYLTYGAGKDWIMMLKVSDEDKARSQVQRGIGQINEMLGQQGGLMLTPVTVAGRKGFTQIMHPMMMMMGGGMPPPVWGCAEGYLIVGSSASAITTCLETGRGDHPRITSNLRFKTEGLIPSSGKADSVGFTDESRKAEELQAMVGGLTMGLGMAGMFAQGAPEEVRSFLSSLPPILGKLVPVVGKLDFFQSTASSSTFDGRRWLTHSVQNYKSPRATKKATSEDEPEVSGPTGAAPESD